MRLLKPKADDLKLCEYGFHVLQETPMNAPGMEMISDGLERCFEGRYVVMVIDHAGAVDRNLFVMSVIPERSTVDKIVDAIVTGKGSYETIKSLWEKNKTWVIEIDEGLLNHKLTDKELVALLLHEVGHVVNSNSVVNRIVQILQFEYVNTKFTNKAMISGNIFRKMLSLPILNACVSDQKDKKNLKEEIKADQFVRKIGYGKYLVSAMDALMDPNKFPKLKIVNPDKEMKDSTNFALNTMENLKERKHALVKRHLVGLRAGIGSPAIESVLGDIYGSWFVDKIEDSDSPHMENAILEAKKEKFLEEYIERTIDSYMKESWIFGKKKLNRIDPFMLDYIQVKMEDIQSNSDKMMLISYINTQLDTVMFYIDILNDPEASKKYTVPHNMSFLQGVRKQLNGLRDRVLQYRVPQKQSDIFVTYPKGYEG